MKRLFTAFIATLALTLALALPASAGAKPGAVQWVCDPGSGPVTFVSAPAKAFHGIDTADSMQATSRSRECLARRTATS